MLLLANGIDLPEWACAEVTARSQDLGIGPDELVRYLVCAHIRKGPEASDAQFTVPRSMESSLVGDDFMVVRRSEDTVVLVPTVSMSFDDALAQFQANGCTEADVLQALSGR